MHMLYNIQDIELMTWTHYDLFWFAVH